MLRQSGDLGGGVSDAASGSAISVAPRRCGLPGQRVERVEFIEQLGKPLWQRLLLQLLVM